MISWSVMKPAPATFARSRTRSPTASSPGREIGFACREHLDRCDDVRARAGCDHLRGRHRCCATRPRPNWQCRRMLSGLASGVVARVARRVGAVVARVSSTARSTTGTGRIVGGGSVAATFVSVLCSLSALAVRGPAPQRDDSLSALHAKPRVVLAGVMLVVDSDARADPMQAHAHAGRHRRRTRLVRAGARVMPGRCLARCRRA